MATTTPRTVPARPPLPRITATRDALIVAAAGAAWIGDTALAGRSDGGTAALGIATGVLTALVGFLTHEWGHLAGALLAGSTVHFPNRIIAPLLFHFDGNRNGRRQFLAMSYGGFAASAVALALLVWLVPGDRWSGRTALVLAGIGTLVTLVAEVPTAVRVARGAPLPTGFAFTPPR
ncbi:MAG: hypothetical protein U0610_08440 [bacterium]